MHTPIKEQAENVKTTAEIETSTVYERIFGDFQRWKKEEKRKDDQYGS